MIVAILISLSFLAASSERGPSCEVRCARHTRDSTPGRCTVQAVIDGRTLKCRDGRMVRLLLIETLDESARSNEAARRALDELAADGSTLRLEYDVERTDGYHSTLAYAYLPDGRMLNEVMASSGVVTLAAFPPNTRHIDRIRNAVLVARTGKRGLWAGVASCSVIDRRKGTC